MTPLVLHGWWLLTDARKTMLLTSHTLWKVMTAHTDPTLITTPFQHRQTLTQSKRWHVKQQCSITCGPSTMNMYFHRGHKGLYPLSHTHTKETHLYVDHIRTICPLKSLKEILAMRMWALTLRHFTIQQQQGRSTWQRNKMCADFHQGQRYHTVKETGHDKGSTCGCLIQLHPKKKKIRKVQIIKAGSSEKVSRF